VSVNCEPWVLIHGKFSPRPDVTANLHSKMYYSSASIHKRFESSEEEVGFRN